MNPRESVRRSLFGPVDHDQLRRDLKQRLREITEEDSRRWNFDFQTETPLPGRFQWEEVPADQERARLRDASCSSPPLPEAGDGLGAQGSDQENCSSISNTHKSPAEVTPVRRKRTHTKPAAKPGRNARITDFLSQYPK
ncbi:hypothetical protein L3Q82_000154 [Scortum barcoo]|uniref:Uncharacterized protein n=1 Tax=Scortum barcoo TaxID=214431 RepID=A0ACB8XA60_9TELE|nr:hypothetical protein L3Q82_000154 [Scortum barcoo]